MSSFFRPFLHVRPSETQFATTNWHAGDVIDRSLHTYCIAICNWRNDHYSQSPQHSTYRSERPRSRLRRRGSPDTHSPFTASRRKYGCCPQLRCEATSISERSPPERTLTTPDTSSGRRQRPSAVASRTPAGPDRVRSPNGSMETMGR